jgi:hypothetical protein
MSSEISGMTSFSVEIKIYGILSSKKTTTMTKLPFFFFLSQVQWLKVGCWISTNPYYKTQTNKQTKLVGNVQTWYKAKPPTTAVPWQLKVQSKYQINTKAQPLNIWACKRACTMDKYLRRWIHYQTSTYLGMQRACIMDKYLRGWTHYQTSKYLGI